VVLSGFVEVGANCFFGVNAAVGNNVKIGADCLVGAGAVVVKDIPEDTVVRGNVSELGRGVSARAFCKVREQAA
jgi:acetyltransferase-like isoleucine patch superfamily enzyme